MSQKVENILKRQMVNILMNSALMFSQMWLKKVAKENQLKVMKVNN